MISNKNLTEKKWKHSKSANSLRLIKITLKDYRNASLEVKYKQFRGGFTKFVQYLENITKMTFLF